MGPVCHCVPVLSTVVAQGRCSVNPGWMAEPCSLVPLPASLALCTEGDQLPSVALLRAWNLSADANRGRNCCSPCFTGLSRCLGPRSLSLISLTQKPDRSRIEDWSNPGEGLGPTCLSRCPLGFAGPPKLACCGSNLSFQGCR